MPQWLRVARDAFVMYCVTEMVKQLAATNYLDIKQITIRLPNGVLAKLERLASHAVQTKSQYLIKLLQQVPDIEVPEEPAEELTPLQLRICSWFARRASTKWTAKELRAYKQNAHLTPLEDVDILERYYTARIPDEEDYRRRDLATLLNNWPGELDRARTFVAGITKKRAIGQGWIGSKAYDILPPADGAKNMTPDEVKAGVAELRMKMGLPLVKNSSGAETEPDDPEP